MALRRIHERKLRSSKGVQRLNGAMHKIDAIIYWPPKDKAYFFRGSNYVRYRLSGGERAEEKVALAMEAFYAI